MIQCNMASISKTEFYWWGINSTLLCSVKVWYTEWAKSFFVPVPQGVSSWQGDSLHKSCIIHANLRKPRFTSNQFFLHCVAYIPCTGAGRLKLQWPKPKLSLCWQKNKGHSFYITFKCCLPHFLIRNSFFKYFLVVKTSVCFLTPPTLLKLNSISVVW